MLAASPPTHYDERARHRPTDRDRDSSGTQTCAAGTRCAPSDECPVHGDVPIRSDRGGASTEGDMAGQPAIFHALLRPSILQMLRATGYHSTKGAVLDSLTDLAARYLSALCEATAAHAVHNHGDAARYTIVDVRMALQDVGALLPDATSTSQIWRCGSGEDGEDEGSLAGEDLRGVDEFLRWFAGPRMKELMDMGRGDGDGDANDYLSALKKKHSKTGEDTKYHDTIIGRPTDSVSEIQVEGGPLATIDEWIMQRSSAYFAPGHAANPPLPNGHSPSSPSAASSGLSSVGDRLDGDGDGDGHVANMALA